MCVCLCVCASCAPHKKKEGGMFYSYQSKEEWVEEICQSLLNRTSSKTVTLMEDCSTNKRVSKVISKLSGAETNVLIMRLPGKVGLMTS